MSSSEFYDKFIDYQISTGINDRIYNLYKRLCKTGISSDTNILEIGCGIGCLTYLLSRKIKKGIIEAVDISEKSIEYAKTNINKPNIYFYSSDALKYEPKHSGFDYVLLFDVLEHINEEEHISLFKKIADWANENTTILINLPNPDYILFDQKNKPHQLQEIDQPIFLYKLVTDLSGAFLEIEHLETYSVWVKNDYQFLMIKKKAEFEEKFISSELSVTERAIKYLQRIFRKIYYHYPPK